ncbi:MAG TPA: GNAT family N-acetyltransferase [Arenimonas sp.]|nr:GNAT family N-acetyltransferase [Arenimonas sp.]HPO23106.1 GNAT family N-acetyltransferase [Arenimonas sp.]
MDTFETRRLLVRRLAAEDRAFYCACYTDQRLMQHIGEPLKAEAALRNFNTVLNTSTAVRLPHYTWVIQEKISQANIGLLGLAFGQLMPEPMHAELGHIMLAEYQNRGYTTEVINQMMDIAFGATRLERIIVNHANENRAVIRIVQRLCFLRESGITDKRSTCRWVLSRDRWQALRALANAV